MGTLDLNFLASFFGWLIVANFLFLIFRVFLFGSSPKNFIYKIHKNFFKVSNKDFEKALYKRYNFTYNAYSIFYLASLYCLEISNLISKRFDLIKFDLNQIF